LIILVLGIVIWLITTQKEKYFKPIIIEKNNNIINNIKDKDYLDTIIYAGIKEINLSGLFINIVPLSDNIKNNFQSDIELKAVITGDNNAYNIYLDTNMNRDQYITTLSHELIHLKQYYTKELVIENGIPIWKGKKVDLNSIDYQDRPWEIEAFAKQNDLEKKINKLLYK